MTIPIVEARALDTGRFGSEVAMLSDTRGAGARTKIATAQPSSQRVFSLTAAKLRACAIDTAGRFRSNWAAISMGAPLGSPRTAATSSMLPNSASAWPTASFLLWPAAIAPL